MDSDRWLLQMYQVNLNVLVTGEAVSVQERTVPEVPHEETQIQAQMEAE